MKRVVKDSVVRRAEILDAAEELFITRGYQESSINDIVRKVEVAKGTFYYYFKTKEEILHAIVQRLVANIMEALSRIAFDPTMPVAEKLEQMLREEFRLTMEKYELVVNLYQIPNVEMYQRILAVMIRNYAPVLAQILEEGNREGIFHTSPPYLETAEIILVAFRILLTSNILQLTAEEYQAKIPKLIRAIEHMLGADNGKLKGVEKVFLELCGTAVGSK